MFQVHVQLSAHPNFTKFLLDNNANPVLIAFTAWNVIPQLHLLVCHATLLISIFISMEHVLTPVHQNTEPMMEQMFVNGAEEISRKILSVLSLV